MKLLVTTLIIAAAAFSVQAEKLHSVTTEGVIAPQRRSFFSILIYHTPSEKVKDINYKLKINDSVNYIKSKLVQYEDYYVLNYDSQPRNIALDPKNNKIEGELSSKLGIITWDDTGDDLKSYIYELQASAKLYTSYTDKQQGLLKGKVVKLRGIVVDRLSFIKDAVENQAENLEKLQEAVEATKTALEEFKKSTTEINGQIDTVKLERDQYDVMINEKKARLEENYDAALDAEIKALEAHLKDLVDDLQKKNNQVYELEKTIKNTEAFLAELENEIANWPETIARYADEVNQRESNIEELDKIAFADSSSGTTVITSGSGDTTVVSSNDDKNDYSFGEIFGIACIPACGIALPVGLIASTAYTEYRVPTGGESELPAGKMNFIDDTNSNLKD